MSDDRTGINIRGPSEFDEMSEAYQRQTDETEYSWGSGLTPKGLEDAQPIDGGRYHGKSPSETFPQISVSREM